jgi:CheY-like chemotaxis protein
MDNATRGFTLGATDCLTKPVDKDQLLAVVRRHAGPGETSEILVVEDDPATRDLMRLALEGVGFRILEADNGIRALERMRESRPDLIVLDLMMPEMDGFEFLAALQDNEDWRRVPVVVATAADLTAEDHKRLNGQVHQVLQKGALSGKRLLEELRAVIHAGAGNGAAMKDTAKIKILYVEDNEDNIVLLKSRLEDHGYSVLVATDGQQGVALAQKELPGAVLMDMRLPVMDGWEATRMLKADERTRPIPIIGVSAHAMVGDREKALAAGCDDYITKPVDIKSLLGILTERVNHGGDQNR